MRVTLKINGYMDVDVKSREHLDVALKRIMSEGNVRLPEVRGLYEIEVEHAFTEKYVSCRTCGCWYLSTHPSYEAYFGIRCSSCEGQGK
jgi:hypothetical protein